MERTNFNDGKINIYVVSYPGTGADWILELVWLLANDLDFANGLKPLKHNEHNVIYSHGIVKTEMDYDSLFGQILPDGKQNKIVYAIRNAEQTCIAQYQNSILDGTIDLDKFCHLFLNGQVFCGSYWDHASSYWLNRHSTEILFIQYEYVQNRLPQAIKKVSDFLGVLLTEYDILSLVYHLSISNLHKQPNTNCTMKPYDDITLSKEISNRFVEQNAYYHKTIGLVLDY